MNPPAVRTSPACVPSARSQGWSGAALKAALPDQGNCSVQALFPYLLAL